MEDVFKRLHPDKRLLGVAIDTSSKQMLHISRNFRLQIEITRYNNKQLLIITVSSH